ncbi:hypothetical protein OsI_15620 [Oryza sativa Indica Group]|uniref:Uncharacterized protein n=1 Tax=Oryza sativa subsp. indica TaxID=39946 RepID=B8AT97_ORYSI|nr:hypothetical protein OsI_15620 [Oryza sativa Indica Group]
MPLLRRPPAAPHRTPIHHDKRLHLFSTHNTRHRATVSSLPVTCLRIRYSSSNPVRHLCGTPSSRCHAAADPAPSKIPGGGSGALEAGVVGWRDLLLQVGEVLSLGFPVWVASACAVALWRPPAFLWVSPMAQIVGISFTMLGMGMTLTLDDLKTALLMPKELASGFLLQYSFLTPLLTSKLAGQYVAVDPMGLFVSTSQVVLAPVLLGALLNQYCNGLVQTIGIDISSSRTISIEVGMQNSVLGVVLASKHFGNPLTAVPCAVSSVCHSVYGSLLAGIWRSLPPNDKGQ